MTNREIADILDRIARILDIQGENPFKVRAYRKASDTVASLSMPLAEIERKGETLSLPGIGEAIGRKISELLDTGRLDYYERLLATDHADLVAFLDIPGMGPKHSRLVYEELGIKTLDALKAAAESGRLRKLPGMGAKTEANILKGIALLRRYKERLPLAFVHPRASAVADALRRIDAVDAVLMAGSLRRMRDTVADADLLAASSDPEAVMAAFTALPMVGEVIARGLTKSSIRTRDDLQVDLRVVASDSFGAAAHYFTGSKAHNIRIRSLAGEQGLKVNEYGVFEGDRSIAGRTEAEVFESLGLPFIPPEIREDRGEIEAALEGRLPRLLAVEDIRGDLHTHSEWSDGTSTIEAMARAARSRGYRYLAVCDHSPHLGVTNGLDARRLLEQAREIDTVNRTADGIRLLKGVEVDILADGSLDLPDEVLRRLDIVVASVHSRFHMDAGEMTRRVVRAVAHPHVHVLGHPTGRLIGRREPYALDMAAVFDACKRHGTAIELNGHPERLDLSDRHCREAKSAGVKVAVDTDAHRDDELDLMTFGVATARRGWLEAADVINTWGLDELMAFLENKGRRT